jgi:hypothetical protein
MHIYPDQPMPKATPSAIRIRPPIPAPSKAPSSSASASYLEAWKRGWSRAQKEGGLGDGSEWIWNQAQQHFPGATQIVDLYHVREPLGELARKLYPNDEVNQNRWRMIHQDLLDAGKIEELMASFRSMETGNPELAEKTRTEVDYFEKNAARLRYPEFRRPGLFVGTGVIEAGCKNLIGFRYRQSGDVLDSARGQRRPRSAMLPIQRPL